MNKISTYILGVICYVQASICYAADTFDILPELPEPLQSANASTVTQTAVDNALENQQIGHEPNLISVVLSLLIVITLIYITGIIYTKLNKVNAKTLKIQQGDLAKTHVSVISTTSLGNHKSLHVIELDGKRMLIGATQGNVQLIKDLGSFDTGDDTPKEYSHIEIPNIKIPKIEIPKIEIPSLDFSKIMTLSHKKSESEKQESDEESIFEENYMTKPEKEPSEIIDSLFNNEEGLDEEEDLSVANEHIVDPDDYALYKKYLG